MKKEGLGVMIEASRGQTTGPYNEEFKLCPKSKGESWGDL